MSASILANLLRENPIAITGMGCVSAAGNSVEDLWDAAIAGESLAAWRDFGPEHQSKFAVCSAPDLKASGAEMNPVRKMDRVVQLAWPAAQQAWRQARLDEINSTERIGIVVGSSRGPLNKTREAFERMGQRQLMPSSGVDTTFAALSGALAQAFKLRGPGATISATCASAAFAIGYAAEQILLENADVMLVGGAEALHPVLLEQLQSAGVLGSGDDAARICRPFDATRTGIVLGEGSAFLVLESASSTSRLGVTPLAQLSGWSARLDDCGRTGLNENGSGLVNVMSGAVDVAGITPEQIGYINAHGTATRMNDIAEAQAVKKFFGLRVSTIPCTSTKPVTGHCLGATPALEAIITIEALRRQAIPPTANFNQPDPCCAVNAQPVLSGLPQFSSAMSNSLGFWGYHASLIFSLHKFK
jgi:3-oxoacyl-[acyl-carrier-protein] synthase II